MKIQSRLSVVIVLFSWAGALVYAGPLGMESQEMEIGPIIRVYNQAHVDVAILDQAKRTTEQIFLNSGVRLRWIDCMAGGSGEDVCRQPVGANEIALRIVRRTKQATKATGPITNGQAFHTPPGGCSGMAAIYYERSEMIAERVQSEHSELKLTAALGIVLGHFTAHELGHLLLPTTAHAPAGIMKSRIESSDWGQAVRGHLLFTEKESGLIRQGLR
jgi:hypothetical protein